MDDWRLLSEYQEKGSEAAFSRLVEEHMKMVYWTCRRDLTNQELAEDAAQVVFVLFARKAAGFNRRVSVSGWLFNASRYVARDFNKREARRRRREEAAIMQRPASDSDSEWRELEPWLNDGLSHLSESDREAILLRYFNGLSTPELASAIGTTEASARKRLSRAVERLRGHFVKKGVTITSVALGGLLAEHSAKAAPAAFHAATMAVLRTPVALPAAHLLTWQQGAYFIMQASKQKILAAVLAVVLLGAVVTLPIAGWKIYRARAVAAEIGSGGFTDLTASSASSNAASDSAATAARSQIVANVRVLVDAFNNHNMAAWSQFISPSVPVTMPGGRQIQTGASAIANNEQTFEAHPDIKVTSTLQSLDVQGDQAVTTSVEHTAWTSTSQDQSGAGHLVTNDETDEIHWKNQGGRWVVSGVVDLGEKEQTH